MICGSNAFFPVIVNYFFSLHAFASILHLVIYSIPYKLNIVKCLFQIGFINLWPRGS